MALIHINSMTLEIQLVGKSGQVYTGGLTLEKSAQA